MKAIDQFRVEGKVAIVTGASRGLGKEIASALASGGAHVAVTSRNQAEVDAVAAEIADQYAVRAVGFAGDLGEPEVAQRLVETVIDSLGGLDILVNNAGVNIRGALDTVTVEDYERAMATNIKAPWLVCRAAAEFLRRQKSGRVINMASTLGLVGMADRSLYCASKGALVQFTRELAVEWAPYNVTVNAICPGPFETEMNRVLIQDSAVYERFANYTALRRWGRAGEIGPVVLFLASAAASYITGAVLPVDGGWTAW